MNPSALLAFSAAVFSGALGVAALFKKRFSLARWLFFAGMTILALESFFAGMGFSNPGCKESCGLAFLPGVTRSFLPGVWLAFSLTYSRGNYSEFLTKWRLFLAVAFVIPIGIALSFRSDLVELLPPVGTDVGWGLKFGQAGKPVNVLCLIVAVMALNNLEKTFRAAVGTMRWRIKFLMLGLAVIFAGRIYSLSQDMLYPAHDLTLTDFDSAALLIGCILMTIAYLRNGFAEIDVYPSQSVLQGTVTALNLQRFLLCFAQVEDVTRKHRIARWQPAN
jgi:hypothetical protein